MLLRTIIRVAVAFAATAVTMSTTVNAASTYPIDVPFFQAAIFFMTGLEPTPPNPPVTFESDKKAIVMDNVQWDSSSWLGTWEYRLEDDKPCILFARLLSPEAAFNTTDPFTGDQNGGRRLEFNKMPSPRAFKHDSPKCTRARRPNITIDFPHETWCSYRSAKDNGEIKMLSGSSTCRVSMCYELSTQWYRRIDALDYIREKYCMGQPEPAPKPRMPY